MNVSTWQRSVPGKRSARLPRRSVAVDVRLLAPLTADKIDAIWLIAGIEHDRVNDRDHPAFGMREDKMPERVDDAPNDLGIR